MLNKSILLPATLIAAAGLSACGGGQDDRGGDPRGRFSDRDSGPPAVEAVEVMFGSFPLEERLAGSVRARNQTEIFAEVAGTIEEVFVDDGDVVEAGDPLVQLRSREFEERVQQAEAGLKVAEARVRQAEANLSRTQADLERVRTVVERGLGTQAELDTAEADAASARADLDLMQAQRDQAASALEEQRAALDETLIRAPIDGVVGGRNAEVGQQASTSASLFTIGDVASLQVDVMLTQQMLDYIDTGTSVNVYSDTRPDEVIEADIDRISPFLHPITHTTRAQINVSAGNRSTPLRPGMFVTVDVLYGESEQAPLVPNSAIYRHPRDGREGVFVTSLDEELRSPEVSDYSVSEQPSENEPVGPVSVQFQPVDVVARGRTSSGVRGVREGDWVVTLGHHLLADSNEAQQAVVQPTPWEHILDLQEMQSRDLLEIIREKQEQSRSGQAEPN